MNDYLDLYYISLDFLQALRDIYSHDGCWKWEETYARDAWEEMFKFGKMMEDKAVTEEWQRNPQSFIDVAFAFEDIFKKTFQMGPTAWRKDPLYGDHSKIFYAYKRLHEFVDKNPNFC